MKDSPQIKELAKKLGKEDFQISATKLVDVLNHKFKEKENGNPFTFGDVQQYYLRESLPEKYTGVKIQMKEGPTGKYLQVYKPVEQPKEEKKV